MNRFDLFCVWFLVIATISLFFFLAEMPLPEHSYQKYTLFNGDTVYCEYAKWSSCGMALHNCQDGKKYMCQNNITEAQ